MAESIICLSNIGAGYADSSSKAGQTMHMDHIYSNLRHQWYYWQHLYATLIIQHLWDSLHSQTPISVVLNRVQLCWELLLRDWSSCMLYATSLIDLEALLTLMEAHSCDNGEHSEGWNVQHCFCCVWCEIAQGFPLYSKFTTFVMIFLRLLSCQWCHWEGSSWSLFLVTSRADEDVLPMTYTLQADTALSWKLVPSMQGNSSNPVTFTTTFGMRHALN